MTIRVSFCLAIVVGWGAHDVVAQTTSVRLQLFPLTGEVRLLNEDSAPFEFTLYTLESPSGALDPSPAVWKSISDTYDVSGNGFIDPINDWIKLDASTTKLTEVGFPPSSVGTLPAYRAISLGKIWNPNASASPDVTVKIQLPDRPTLLDCEKIGDPLTCSVAIDGDYVGNFTNTHNVGNDDYGLWKLLYGRTDGYFADGNIDGIVDAADYTIWRDNLGASWSISGDEGPGAGGLAAAAVPEPASLLLTFAAAGGWLLRRTRRRQFVL